MLRLLTISNFVTIERLEVELAPGFNVLTGETGAGKSIVVDAVGLLLGDRSDASMVRAGARQARIEGVFDVAPDIRQRVVEELGEDALAPDEDEVIVVREVNAEGRSVCRVNGRTVPLKSLDTLGGFLVDVHGQGKSLLLLRPREHVDILDRYAGLVGLRGQVAEAVHRLQAVRRELTALNQDEQDRARKLDLLQYEVQEIEDARLRPGEDEELEQERTLLSNMESLMTASDEAHATLNGGTEWGVSATDLLGRVVESVTELARLDPSLEELRATVEGLASQAEDVAHTLRSYREGLEYSPERLEEVEERLDLILRLKRKYGETIPDINAFAEKASRELESLSTSEERKEALAQEEDTLLRQAGGLASTLSERRKEAALRLSREVERELGDLAMERTRIAVDIRQREANDGVPLVSDGRGPRYAFDATGIDTVEFLISPNPGEPLRPLAKTASGGETSRIMLAIKSVLSSADPVPTLVFDEVDAGIGGRMGAVVGGKLWRLSQRRQVLCVTHLPQLAAFAENHLYVVKDVVNGRTVTTVRALEEGERVQEIGQMLGGTGAPALRNAEEMLAQARAWKE